MFWILMLHLAVSCGRLFTRAEEACAGRIGGQVEQVAGVSGGIMAIETRQPGEPLFGRQMTNGQDLLKLIYAGNGRRLASCERFEGQTPELTLFLHHFSNITSSSVLQLGQRRVRGEGAKLKDGDDFNWPPIDWQRSWKDCDRLHQVAQQQQQQQLSPVHRPRSRRRASSWIFPGTAYCGAGNRSEVESHAVNDDNADSVNVFSVHVETDRCCINHDRCPYTIERFTRKYNYYNFRLYTISDCECDARFRRCLVMAGDANSHMVGNLFFNVIGMKCFTIELEEVCAERAWWGKCIRNRMEPTARIRDPTPYNSPINS